MGGFLRTGNSLSPSPKHLGVGSEEAGQHLFGEPPEFLSVAHFLAPESPPDESWTYDETVDVRAIRPTGPSPVGRPFLVVPES